MTRAGRLIDRQGLIGLGQQRLIAHSFAASAAIVVVG
jgi:hypothetical protein